MSFKIVSVQPMTFKDKQTGADVTMYRCFLLMQDGGVASVTSRVERKPGHTITLRIVAGYDGKLAVRVAE